MAGQWSALIRRLLCGQTFQSDLIYLFPRRFFYPHPNEYEISLKSASIVSYEYIYEAAAREKLARSMQAINSFYTRGQQTVSHHKMERTRKDERFHWRRLNIIFAFQGVVSWHWAMDVTLPSGFTAWCYFWIFFGVFYLFFYCLLALCYI